MKRNIWLIMTVALMLAIASTSSAYAATIVLNTEVNNFTPIVEVTLEVDGAEIVQTASSSTRVPDVNTFKPVHLVSLVVDDGGDVIITPFNTSGVTVKLTGLAELNIAGVGVIEPQLNSYNLTTLADGKIAFKDAAEGTFENLNLHNYIFFDGVTPRGAAAEAYPTPPESDFEIHYQEALKADDYLVVMERYGNSHFQIWPVDSSGNQINDTNVLQFGRIPWDSDPVWDWDTGYAHGDKSDIDNSYQLGQSYWLMVAKVGQFFDGDAEDLYRLAIQNKGEADIKLFTFREPPPPPQEPCQLYTQGYWRNKGYRDGWPAPPVIDDHPDISYDDFFGLGSWIDVLKTPPRGGDAYYNLAHQFIAAFLNMQHNKGIDCCVPSNVEEAFESALLFFHGESNYYGDYAAPGKLVGRMNAQKQEARAAVLGWAEILDNWNNGMYCSY